MKKFLSCILIVLALLALPVMAFADNSDEGSAGEGAPQSSENPFADVAESQYYYDAVLWTVENGITTGLSATSFGPNSICTRDQTVTFLYRAYQ